MAKNIVICCDGTGNEYGDRNSNVVKLYRALVRDADSQVAYYHPGVGTMGAKNALTTAGKVWTKIRGLAFGYGLSENIADAYRYLMQTYQPEDTLFIFGFSRGAYTARALCGMLQMFGLLAPGNEALIPYALRLFKRDDESLLRRMWRFFTSESSKFKTAAGFKSTFCKDCEPYFLGLWDTVSSVGWILDPIGLKPGRLPYTYALGDVTKIRHAVSIDERRAFFRQNLVSKVDDRDIKEVWFPGVHSDVGGSYPEAESGLSKISLQWMLREASEAKLKIDDSYAARVLGEDPRYALPMATSPIHNSLTPVWWIGEFWFKWTRRRVSDPAVDPPKYVGYPRANLFRRRQIPSGACIHESVLTRQNYDPTYRPSNLPSTFVFEQEPAPTIYPLRVAPGASTTVTVYSRLLWNDTAVEVKSGEVYELAATGEWDDASIKAGPEGYESPNLVFRSIEWLRRAPKADWFCLIGCVGRTLQGHFVIGKAVQITAATDGILHCFANDLPRFYWNNSGFLTLTITRIS